MMFIDTSGWLCVYHKDEPQHAEAVKFYDNAASRMTHGYVLAEFVPLAQVRGFPRQSNLKFSERILEDEEIEVIWVNEDLHRLPLNSCKSAKIKPIRSAMPLASS